MSDDERVLRSFVADDEELLGIWPVSKASFSKGPIAPRHVSEQTVAVTEDRVCWFADELNEVSIDDVDRTDLDFVSQEAAAPMVMGGGLLFVLGVFGSIGAFFAGVGDVFLVSMPALTGLAIFLGSRVVADATGREGETRAGHRLTLWTDDEEVAIWSEDEAPLEAIEAAVVGDDESATGSEDDSDIDDGEPADRAIGERTDERTSTEDEAS